MFTRVRRLIIPLALLASCERSSSILDNTASTPTPTAVPREVPAHAPGAPLPGQSADELKTPLAKIDDITITLGELQERINRQSPYIRARYTSLEQKREFLDSLIRMEVLAKEAVRRGLDKDPEVIRTMKQVMIQKLMRDEFDARVTADSITDAEMKKFYDANLAEYVKPEEVRTSAIILKNKAQADRVLIEAKGEAGKTNKGFRDLVGKYTSDEDSKLRGGDLRYLELASKEAPPAVVKAAFGLVNTGDVSDVVDAGNGTFYILKQTGRRHSMTKSFEDAKPQIRNKLFRDKRLQAQKDFLDESRAKAKVEIDEANLAKVRIDTSNATGGDDGHGHDLVPPPAAPGVDLSPPPPPITP
ncbi:MAG: peptidyl-prolyl cis-trans isomerase, partial [Proteobacteria bacterium]|nr:peptidyl-prolyl cis-trans isomerase [Pseudomonadota bacterium]